MFMLRFLGRAGVRICDGIIRMFSAARDAIDDRKYVVNDIKGLFSVPKDAKEIVVNNVRCNLNLDKYSKLESFTSTTVGVNTVPASIRSISIPTAPVCSLVDTHLERVHISNGQFPELPDSVTEISCDVRKECATFAGRKTVKIERYAGMRGSRENIFVKIFTFVFGWLL